MKEVKLPGGDTVLHTGTDEEAAQHQRMIDARHKFIVAYCREKGWSIPGEADFHELSMTQILEIRAQPGWKNPLNEDDPQESTILIEPGGMTVIPKDKH